MTTVAEEQEVQALFTKDFVKKFEYDWLRPNITWAEQFSNYAGLKNHQNETLRDFGVKLRKLVMKQKAIELVRQHTSQQ